MQDDDDVVEVENIVLYRVQNSKKSVGNFGWLIGVIFYLLIYF